MAEIPELIKAILHEEGISPACWKRLKDAWPKPPEVAIAAAWTDLLSARSELVKAQENVQLVEIRTLPEGCVTLEDAERAMIAAAVKGSRSTADVLAAASRLGMGKTTLFRKLKKYNIPSINNSAILKDKIGRLKTEVARLEKILAEREK